MEYKTYIDESGNTGSDLLNSSQKIFCLSSVTNQRKWRNIEISVN